MKTMGLLISHKNNEKRRAILPEHVKLLKHPEEMYFETGYGHTVGVTDQEYIDCGCHVVPREEAMKCDICNKKMIYFKLDIPLILIINSFIN